MIKMCMLLLKQVKNTKLVTTLQIGQEWSPYVKMANKMGASKYSSLFKYLRIDQKKYFNIFWGKAKNINNICGSFDSNIQIFIIITDVTQKYSSLAVGTPRLAA